MFNLKSIFKSKNSQQQNKEYIAAPLSGKVVSITEVPDPVFSEKMMGDGFAILPSSGKVVSPIEGKVVSVFPTKHAIGLKSINGREIIIHFGLETVALNGLGFEVMVSEGQTIKVGDLLLKVDIDKIKDRVPSIITPVIVTNLESEESIVIEKIGEVTFGEQAVAYINK